MWTVESDTPYRIAFTGIDRSEALSRLFLFFTDKGVITNNTKELITDFSHVIDSDCTDFQFPGPDVNDRRWVLINSVDPTLEMWEAVRKTIADWNWFAAHPGCDKLDYINWVDPTLKQETNYCRLCSKFYDTKPGVPCNSLCPLMTVGGCYILNNPDYSLSKSPYDQWVEHKKFGRLDDASVAAKEIVRLCEQWLINHHKEESCGK